MPTGVCERGEGRKIGRKKKKFLWGKKTDLQPDFWNLKKSFLRCSVQIFVDSSHGGEKDKHEKN